MLAAEERRHQANAEQLEAKYIQPGVREKEGESERRLFVLQFVQPGRCGSHVRFGLDAGATLAAALRARVSWPTLLVDSRPRSARGFRGFGGSHADDGSLPAGQPLVRGLVLRRKMTAPRLGTHSLLARTSDR